MKKSYTLAVKKAGDTVGLIQLNPYYTAQSRYVDIIQDNKRVERFDLLATNLLSVSTVLEIIDVSYRDKNEEPIGGDTIDLRPFTKTKETGFE